MRRPVFSLLVVIVLVASWSLQARAESNASPSTGGLSNGVITKAYAAMDAYHVDFAGAPPALNDILQVSRHGQPICQVIYVQFPNYGHVVTRVDPEPGQIPQAGDTVSFVKPGPSVNPHRFAMLRSFQQAGVVANLQGQVYNEYYNGAVYGIRGGPEHHHHHGRYHSDDYYSSDRFSEPLYWSLPGPGPMLLNSHW